MSRVHFVAGITGDKGGSFDPGRDMAALEEAAKELPAVRLLILDPIVSAVTGDGHKSNDVRRSLQPVVDMAARLGCAVLGITHFSKGTAGRDPVERITGSLAYAALARVVLVAAKVRRDGDGDLNGANGEPRRVLVRAKSNVGPDGGGFAYALERVPLGPGLEGQRVRWLHALAGSAQEVLAEAETDPADAGDDSPADIESFVRSCLANGPIPAKSFKEDAEGAGFKWHMVMRAAKRMGATAKKDSSMRGVWRWALQHPAEVNNSPRS